MYKKIDFLVDFLGSNVYKQNYFEYPKTPKPQNPFCNLLVCKII